MSNIAELSSDDFKFENFYVLFNLLQEMKSQLLELFLFNMFQRIIIKL